MQKWMNFGYSDVNKMSKSFYHVYRFTWSLTLQVRSSPTTYSAITRPPPPRAPTPLSLPSPPQTKMTDFPIPIPSPFRIFPPEFPPFRPTFKGGFPVRRGVRGGFSPLVGIPREEGERGRTGMGGGWGWWGSGVREVGFWSERCFPPRESPSDWSWRSGNCVAVEGDLGRERERENLGGRGGMGSLHAPSAVRCVTSRFISIICSVYYGPHYCSLMFKY